MRLIGVVMNAPENEERDSHYKAMAAMMDYGFSSYTAKQLGRKGDVVGSVRISGSKVNSMDVVLGSDVNLPVTASSDFEPKVEYDYPRSLQAPVAANEPVGKATFTDEEGKNVTVDLYLKEGVERYTFGLVFKQVWQRFFSALL